MPADSAAQLREYDEAKVSGLHWKIMLVSGMGFFTDAYDLFIIGVAMAMIKSEWHPSAVETGLVTSTALLASAVGAVLFGRVADLLGRKRIYGVEVLVLAAGAIACGFAPNIAWLIVFRIILGLGIGGDYPVSATIMSEYAGKRSRGMLISLVFAMQAAGLIFGPIFAAALLASNLNHDIVWRIYSRSGQFRRWRSSTGVAKSTRHRDSKSLLKSDERSRKNQFALRVISSKALIASSQIPACEPGFWALAWLGF